MKRLMGAIPILHTKILFASFLMINKSGSNPARAIRLTDHGLERWLSNEGDLSVLTDRTKDYGGAAEGATEQVPSALERRAV